MPYNYRGFDPIQVPTSDMNRPPLFDWMKYYTPYQPKAATDRRGENVIGVKYPWEDDPERDARRDGALNEAAMASGVNMYRNPPPSNYLIPRNPDPYRGFGPIDTPLTPQGPGQSMFGLGPSSVARRQGEDDTTDGDGTGTGTGSGSGSGSGVGPGSGSGTGGGTGSGSGTGAGSGTGSSGTGTGSGTGVGTGTGTGTGSGNGPNTVPWGDIWDVFGPDTEYPGDPQAPPTADLPRGYATWEIAKAAWDWEIQHGNDFPYDMDEDGPVFTPSGDNPYGAPDLEKYPGSGGSGSTAPPTSGGGGSTGSGGGGSSGTTTPPPPPPPIGDIVDLPDGTTIPIGNYGPDDLYIPPPRQDHPHPSVTWGDWADLAKGIAEAYGAAAGGGGGGSQYMPGETGGMPDGGPGTGGSTQSGGGGLGGFGGGGGAMDAVSSLLSGDWKGLTQSMFSILPGGGAVMAAGQIMEKYLDRLTSDDRAKYGMLNFENVANAFWKTAAGRNADNVLGWQGTSPEDMQFMFDFAKQYENSGLRGDQLWNERGNQFFMDNPYDMLNSMVSFARDRNLTRGAGGDPYAGYNDAGGMVGILRDAQAQYGGTSLSPFANSLLSEANTRGIYAYNTTNSWYEDWKRAQYNPLPADDVGDHT